MKEKFDVSGMTCASCQAHVEKAVRKVPGVKDVTVNLLSNNMVVEFEEGQSSAQEVVRAVEDAGYGASPAGAKASQSAAQPSELPAEKQMRSMRFRLIVSFLMLVPMMYVSMGHMVGLPLPHILHGTENAMSFALVQFFLALPVLYVNRAYFENGFKALLHRTPNMDSLIAIGSAAGVFYPLLGWRLSPMFAAAAMSLSSVCVVTNALRLRFFRPRSRAEAIDQSGRRMTPAAPETAVPRAAGETKGQEEDDSGMKKIMTVESMSCNHCKMSVEKALSAVEGVKHAEVDLEKKTAAIALAKDVSDDVLRKAVSDAGFEPGAITVKKGLLS